MENWLAGLIIVALAAVLIVVLLRRPRDAGDLSTPLQNLTQSVQQGQAQSAVIVEKLSQLSERVGRVESGQTQAGLSLAETGTVAKTLVAATAAIREEINRAKNDLTELQTHAKARQQMEQQTADSIRRLESVIAGTQSKGAAGENIVEVVFSKLPQEWQVRNFRVGNKAVEFGIRLPNNLVLPIDSKWAATNLLEQFCDSSDPAEQLKLKGQIESVVLSKSREVRKYICPNVTVNFAIATVPDAIYDLCFGIQADVFQQNVVLVSYSMLVPYLLLVFQTILRTSQNIDIQQLDACLENVGKGIEAVQKELEGRFANALKMLGNSRDDMAVHLGKVSTGLTSLRLSSKPALSDGPLELEAGIESVEG